MGGGKHRFVLEVQPTCQRGHGRRRVTSAHLEGQVGRDDDARAQVHVAVLVADEQRGVALGLGLHLDTATVLGPRGQPPCRRGGAKSCDHTSATALRAPWALRAVSEEHLGA